MLPTTPSAGATALRLALVSILASAMSPASDIETLSLASIWTWVAGVPPHLGGLCAINVFISHLSCRFGFYSDEVSESPSSFCPCGPFFPALSRRAFRAAAGEKHRGELLQVSPSWSLSGSLGVRVPTNAPGFSGSLHLGEVLGMLELGADGGKADRLFLSGLKGPLLLGVFAGQDVGLLVAEGACAGG